MRDAGGLKPPILAFEMTWSGTTHAPGNGATLSTVALAFPGHPLHVFAEASHLRELRADATLAASARPVWHPIVISRHFQGRTGVVSLRRLAREFATVARALRSAGRGTPCLLLLLSATPTAIFAASWAARLHGRAGVQVGLHGNLNEVADTRSRNPLLRALDLQAALRAGHGGRIRFLVLERSIRDTLAIRHPAAAARTDVLPLPANMQEAASAPAVWPASPLRVGFVGQATAAKGIDLFLAVARAMRTAHGDRIAFHLVGRAMPGADLDAFDVLEEPPATEHLSRAAFVQRLSALHYVMLPFRPGYYDLAASGALIDAVTLGKPVIATRVGFVDALFEEGGDIGHLCRSDAALLDVLEGLLRAPDPARYRSQVSAMGRLRARREPAALALAYAETIRRNFPFFIRN